MCDFCGQDSSEEQTGLDAHFGHGDLILISLAMPDGLEHAIMLSASDLGIIVASIRRETFTENEDGTTTSYVVSHESPVKTFIPWEGIERIESMDEWVLDNDFQQMLAAIDKADDDVDLVALISQTE